MKRYIDAEKLKAKIERRMGMHRKASADGYIIDPNRLDEDEDILSLITSLQQEQPEVDLEKACDAYCKVCGHYPHTTPTYICRQDCDYFRDFEASLNTRKEE